MIPCFRIIIGPQRKTISPPPLKQLRINTNKSIGRSGVMSRKGISLYFTLKINNEVRIIAPCISTVKKEWIIRANKTKKRI